MELITILNRCYRQKGFVYQNASFVGQRHHEIEVSIVPRKHSRANCSGCGKPCPGYDRLPSRRYEFIPFWGFKVYLIYAKRRIQCSDCGVVAEAIPWARGKHHLGCFKFSQNSFPFTIRTLGSGESLPIHKMMSKLYFLGVCEFKVG